MSQQIIFSQCLVGHEEISMNAELVAVFLELANNPISATMAQKALPQTGFHSYDIYLITFQIQIHLLVMRKTATPATETAPPFGLVWDHISFVSCPTSSCKNVRLPSSATFYSLSSLISLAPLPLRTFKD